MFDVKQELPKAPLYREEFEHDNCGIGACVNIHGEKSRATVENALKIVENLEHRAGKDAAKARPGDRCRYSDQIPTNFCQSDQGSGHGHRRRERIRCRHVLLPAGRTAPQSGQEDVRDHCGKEGMEFLGWREVPTFPNVLGHKAVECMPYIMQGFVKSLTDVEKDFPLTADFILQDVSSSSLPMIPM